VNWARGLGLLKYLFQPSIRNLTPAFNNLQQEQRGEFTFRVADRHRWEKFFSVFQHEAERAGADGHDQIDLLTPILLANCVSNYLKSIVQARCFDVLFEDLNGDIPADRPWNAGTLDRTISPPFKVGYRGAASMLQKVTPMLARWAVLCGWFATGSVLALGIVASLSEPWPLWGQSYGLFFALVANDHERFDRLLHWTNNNLAGGDLGTRLPGWLWGKTPGGQWQILDQHSASDADLWIAYSLCEAGRLWRQPLYGALGRRMLARIAARR
jgi:hypothetical protein